METDKTIYPEYTKDNEIHDLKNIISSLETKIEKLEKQFAISGVVRQSELLIALKECRRWMINKGVNVESDFFKNIDKAINCC